MAVEYRCPNCGHVIPHLDLDDRPPSCPYCQGATQAGPPPVVPPPPQTIRVPPLPLPASSAETEEPGEPIDIRRKDVFPRAPAAVRWSLFGHRAAYWFILFIAILGMRACSQWTRHRDAVRWDQAPFRPFRPHQHDVVPWAPPERER
jgi:hypothetical protein